MSDSTQMAKNNSFESTLSHAAQLLGDRLGQPVTLKAVERLDSQHLVLRCQILGPQKGVLATAIIKQLIDNPQSNQFPPRQQFLNEWANLQFLTYLGLDDGPRLYASDTNTQMIIIEDLGRGPSLLDILNSQDPDRAATALVKWGTLLGRLHDAAAPHLDTFADIQSSLGTTNAICDGSVDVRRLLPPLQECLNALSVTPTDDFIDAVAEVGAAMHEDPPWRTLVHFDAGPHNCIQTENAPKLLDFEFAGAGNGLIDLVGPRMAFPPAYRGGRIPNTVIEKIENGYQAERAASVPLAAEDSIFRSALTQACAHWALVKLGEFWENYLRDRLAQDTGHETREDRTPERAAYFRQMTFTYLLSFAETAAEWEQMDALRTTIQKVMAALQTHWTDLEPWPLYPAFQAPPLP
jgi:tRNA A-37 threonylcarbamoyl transferase component Bud32